LKIQPPRNYPGAQDRSLFEFQKWILAVSQGLGVNPPATLEEVGEQSIVPILSQLKDNSRNIDNVTRTINSLKRETNELRRRIDDLERSI